jgi:hypothetical protein
MSARTRCDDCGKWVEADEETGEPVDHACTGEGNDDQYDALSPLDFDE